MQPNVTNCLYSELVEPHKLIPHPRNPNTHPDEQIRLLAKVIDHTGWRHPIVVSTRSGFIIEGHARLLAAQFWGYDKVPVHYQDWENEAMEWADLVADNRLAELAEIDRPTLKDILQDMDTGAMDMEVTGFDDEAIEALMIAYPPIEVADAGNPWGLRGNISAKGLVVGVGKFLALLDRGLVEEAVEAIKGRWGEDPQEALDALCRRIVDESPST